MSPMLQTTQRLHAFRAMPAWRSVQRLAMLSTLLLALTGCGGGGGSPGACVGSAAVCSPSQNTQNPPGLSTDSVSSLANICTPEGEKRWVRAYLDDVYLWYQEIVDVTPAAYATPQDYFYALLVRPKDRFSFTAPQADIDQYYQSGQEIGYGANFVNQGDHLRVAYTDPNTPAAQQNIIRGAEIIAINGVPIEQVSAADRITALYPSTVGASNQFTVLDAGSAAARTVRLNAVIVIKSPVPATTIINTVDSKKIGYLAFTDHVATAEAPLIAAMTQFQQGGIDDLVLDLRYNSGGFLYIASELAAMIGGASVQGKVFEQLQFNAKHPEKTSDPDNRIDFPIVSTNDSPLPQLNLTRVFVLTGPDTCSASESIINSLPPFMQVISIGGTTCGKPYGFIQKNNCSTAYFAIQFAGVNNAGQGSYTNGFAPACAVADDLEHPLGDIRERLLQTAIAYRASGSCPATGLTQALTARYAPAAVRQVYRAPWRDNRLLK